MKTRNRNYKVKYSQGYYGWQKALSYFLLLGLCVLMINIVCSYAHAETGLPPLPFLAQKSVLGAQQAIEKKEYEKAKQILEKYITKYKRNNHYLVSFMLGNLYSISGDSSKALTYYNASINLYPSFGPCRQNMGKTYFDLKQYNKAGDSMLKAYELCEKNKSSILYHAAVFYVMGNDAKKALPHLEYLVSGKAGPLQTEWVEALVRVCMDLKLNDRGIKLTNRLLVKNRNNPQLWKMLTRFYIAKADYKQAASAMKVYSYLAAPEKKDLILLGDLCSMIGIPVKAAEYYEKVIESEMSSHCYEKLVSAYISAHKPDKAEKTLNRAMASSPSARLSFLKGWLHYEKEEFDAAHRAFLKSTQTNRESGRAFLMMGYCALRMKDDNAARFALKKAARFANLRRQAEKLLKEAAL